MKHTRKVFLIPVNDDEDDTSVTVMRIDMGEIPMRSAKRKLRTIFKEWGVPVHFQKKMIKELCRD